MRSTPKEIRDLEPSYGGSFSNKSSVWNPATTYTPEIHYAAAGVTIPTLLLLGNLHPS